MNGESEFTNSGNLNHNRLYYKFTVLLLYYVFCVSIKIYNYHYYGQTYIFSTIF